jgi:hypothetical protein
LILGAKAPAAMDGRAMRDGGAGVEHRMVINFQPEVERVKPDRS